MSYSVLPDGFIRHYLYTGRKESEFSCDVQETNQLRSEKKMRELAARHCFRGILAAPMGRVYRGIIAPWEESMQAMLNWLFPAAPYATCPSLSFWATTRYTPPADLEEIAAGTGAFHYTTSNARIDGYKTGDYLLTSVQSPRRDGVQRVWQPEEREEMRDHFIYVKSLNEHFHGTTQFQPGEYGYQQHMWYAALSDDLVVCGSTAESGSFDAFCQSCLDRPVAFDPHTATLHCAEFDLPFTAGSNGTQILD